MNKFLVTVINSAGDYIEHKRFDSKEEAEKYVLTVGSHCIIEIWEFIKSN